MSNQSSPKANSVQSVVLKPTHQLPLIITTLGLILLAFPINPWPAVAIVVFGLFLLLQSFTLKLEFTNDALVVWQLGRELRRFPFAKWLAWRIFLPQLPGILYFREEASPHLLPILFDPNMLESQLRLKVGDLEAAPASSSKKD